MSEFAQLKVNHVAIYAKDLKETNQFYEEVIGLPKIEDPFKDHLHTWFGMGYGLSIHVIEREVPWKEQNIDRTNHLCFCVKDMDAFINKLKDKNVPFGNSKGLNGKVNLRPDGIHQIFFQDPNGYWLEINDDFE
ncbi:VOC family protein [Cyclobacterium sp. 1_MG-2023]|uniref:VOC family protein n=1 Tax=Cyclobacterium sp. 1_MG-2023 TaxID=3062681 RepID=UPI0026E12D2D|nr:VOC family protein [Cyclobacterium sp. 1_MG-2023]MDO6440418.1 VOC family protein [Cyclobacterium sp. 1_MG-2023]